VNKKLQLATVSLAGCFGCHMSFLDMDERLLALLERIELGFSPFTDIKTVQDCDIALIEGGLCNTANVETLIALRRHSRVLVAVGACAINGGIPAMRNTLTVRQCLEGVYLQAADLTDPQIPCDPELPRLLDQVRPIHSLVHVDYSLPGCPPPADAFYELVLALSEGRTPHLPAQWRRFD
jgi:NAD-reducing hydrogenase small subunit